MRRPLQLSPTPALLAVLLVAAGCLAAPPMLKEVCSRVDGITCSCSHQYPEIDVVSIDTGYLSGAQMITIENCSVVKLAPHSLEKTAGLLKLSVRNVSHLELQSPLPTSLKEFVLSDISELAPIPYAVFQANMKLESLIMHDVAFQELEPNFLYDVTTNFTEITGCRFPNLSSHFVYFDSQHLILKENHFGNLSSDALMVVSDDATVSDNSFGTLANGSIQWHHSSEGGKSKLSFQRNTIQSLEKGALSVLRGDRNLAIISDNVLLCLGGVNDDCGSLAAVPGDLGVCDAGDVCPFRKRTALTEALAKERGCAAGAPLSAEMCAVIAVDSIPSEAATGSKKPPEAAVGGKKPPEAAVGGKKPAEVTAGGNDAAEVTAGGNETAEVAAGGNKPSGAARLRGLSPVAATAVVATVAQLAISWFAG